MNDKLQRVRDQLNREFCKKPNDIIATDSIGDFHIVYIDGCTPTIIPEVSETKAKTQALAYQSGGGVVLTHEEFNQLQEKENIMETKTSQYRVRYMLKRWEYYCNNVEMVDEDLSKLKQYLAYIKDIETDVNGFQITITSDEKIPLRLAHDTITYRFTY